MRRTWTLALAVLLVVSAGCDTTQPTVTGQQTLSIQFATGNALVPLWDIWDIYTDADGDNIPDDDEVFAVICRPVEDNQGNRVTVFAPAAPWYFNVEVELIRAGSTVRERLTTASAASAPRANLTPFDGTVTLGATEECPEDLCGAPGFLFLNPRRMSSANQYLFERDAPGEPQRVDCPNISSIGDAGLNDPAGSGVPPRSPGPFTITVSKGDTIEVRLRKGDQPAGFDVRSAPLIVSRATIAGQLVASDSTESAAGSPLSYVVTVR